MFISTKFISADELSLFLPRSNGDYIGQLLPSMKEHFQAKGYNFNFLQIALYFFNSTFQNNPIWTNCKLNMFVKVLKNIKPLQKYTEEQKVKFIIKHLIFIALNEDIVALSKLKHNSATIDYLKNSLAKSSEHPQVKPELTPENTELLSEYNPENPAKYYIEVYSGIDSLPD